jgi:hypothetical protein
MCRGSKGSSVANCTMMQASLLRACRQVVPTPFRVLRHRRGIVAQCGAATSKARRSLLLGLLAGSIHTTALAAQPVTVMAAGNQDIEKVGVHSYLSDLGSPLPPIVLPCC